MATKNSITGDDIKSKSLSKEGRDNFDNIFSKRNAQYWLDKYHSGVNIPKIKKSKELFSYREFFDKFIK